jgi:hypothetical protein
MLYLPADLKAEDLRKIIVAQGWLEQLRYWGESSNKQVRLQAIQVLGNLVKDGKGA